MPELRILMIVMGSMFTVIGGALMAVGSFLERPLLWRWGVTLFLMGMNAHILVAHDG